jgi:hypothetical protein
MTWLIKALDFIRRLGLFGIRVFTDVVRPPVEGSQILRQVV